MTTKNRNDYAAEFTDDDRDTRMKVRYDRAQTRSEARSAVSEGLAVWEANHPDTDAQDAAREAVHAEQAEAEDAYWAEYESSVYDDDPTGAVIHYDDYGQEVDFS